MVTSIFLTISMHIRPTKLLKVGPLNARYNFKKRLCKKYMGTNWDNDSKIKGTMITDNNKNNEKEVFSEKNK